MFSTTADCTAGSFADSGKKETEKALFMVFLLLIWTDVIIYYLYNFSNPLL